MSRARNSARIWASRRSVFLVLSAITRSFLGLASTTFSAKGSTQLHEPEVAGGGLDDHLEGPELPEELDDLVGLLAVEGLASQDLSVLVHDADGDRSSCEGRRR